MLTMTHEGPMNLQDDRAPSRQGMIQHRSAGR
jgi:hypothetical protein